MIFLAVSTMPRSQLEPNFAKSDLPLRERSSDLRWLDPVRAVPFKSVVGEDN